MNCKNGNSLPNYIVFSNSSIPIVVWFTTSGHESVNFTTNEIIKGKKYRAAYNNTIYVTGNVGVTDQFSLIDDDELVHVVGSYDIY
ncbi:MAG: hypothetical protein IPJ13_09235 [Saprospiraceae bacterium]|nr:hypothetical protein [Saprospiraceae bacterium]